jgi:hypothetical protein
MPSLLSLPSLNQATRPGKPTELESKILLKEPNLC